MDLTKWIIGGQIAIAIIAVGIIIYLIFRRIKLRKEETFEKRSN